MQDNELALKAEIIRKHLKELPEDAVHTLCAALLAVNDPERLSWSEIIKELKKEIQKGNKQ